jgi:hypothetical protein
MHMAIFLTRMKPETTRTKPRKTSLNFTDPESSNEGWDRCGNTQEAANNH